MRIFFFYCSTQAGDCERFHFTNFSTVCLPASHECETKRLSTGTNQTECGLPNRNECRLQNCEFRIRHHCEWCSKCFPLFLCDSKSWIETADYMQKKKIDLSSWLLMKSAVAYYLLFYASLNQCQVHSYYYYARWCFCIHPFTYSKPETRSDGHLMYDDEWKKKITSVFTILVTLDDTSSNISIGRKTAF